LGNGKKDDEPADDICDLFKAGPLLKLNVTGLSDTGKADAGTWLKLEADNISESPAVENMSAS
jgi:hypothetical protein